MQIGEIAKQSGFTKDTLRYYEKIGLIKLDKKSRGENNYRIYDDTIIQRLSLIRKMKNAGFTLNEIKDLNRMEELNMVSCNSVGNLVDNKLEKITQQILKLEQSKRMLLEFKEKCKGNCLETLTFPGRNPDAFKFNEV